MRNWKLSTGMVGDIRSSSSNRAQWWDKVSFLQVPVRYIFYILKEEFISSCIHGIICDYSTNCGFERQVDHESARFFESVCRSVRTNVMPSFRLEEKDSPNVSTWDASRLRLYISANDIYDVNQRVREVGFVCTSTKHRTWTAFFTREILCNMTKWRMILIRTLSLTNDTASTACTSHRSAKAE